MLAFPWQGKSNLTKKIAQTKKIYEAPYLTSNPFIFLYGYIQRVYEKNRKNKHICYLSTK